MSHTQSDNSSFPQSPLAASVPAPPWEDDKFKRNVVANREGWLNAAVAQLDQLDFTPAGYALPKNVRVSCSWPAYAALGQKRRRVGEVWDASVSRDGVFEVFISPTIDDPVEVLAILAHELVHIVVGLKAGHRGPFKACATAVGLKGPMTASRASDQFKRIAHDLIDAIGPYPHGAIDPFRKARKAEGEPDDGAADPPLSSAPKPQKARLLKAVCSECELTLRLTAKWVRGRALTCPDMGCPGHGEPLLFPDGVPPEKSRTPHPS